MDASTEPGTSVYSCTTVAITKDKQDRIGAEWRAHERREVGSPGKNALGLIVGMACIGGVVGLLPLLASQPYGIWAPAVFAGIGGLFAILMALRIRRGKTALDAAVAQLSMVEGLKEHKLRIGDGHRFWLHEHGVLLLQPLDRQQCVCWIFPPLPMILARLL